MKYKSIEDKVKVLTLWNKGNPNKYFIERLNKNVRMVQPILGKNRHQPASSPVVVIGYCIGYLAQRRDDQVLNCHRNTQN